MISITIGVMIVVAITLVVIFVGEPTNLKPTNLDEYVPGTVLSTILTKTEVEASFHSLLKQRMNMVRLKVEIPQILH